MTISVFWRDKVDRWDRVLCDDFRDDIGGTALLMADCNVCPGKLGSFGRSNSEPMTSSCKSTCRARGSIRAGLGKPSLCATVEVGELLQKGAGACCSS